MLNKSYLREQIKVINRAKGFSIEHLVVVSRQLVIDATVATDLFKSHVREYLKTTYYEGSVEARISNMLIKFTKVPTIRDDYTGAGKYYPAFLMTPHPRGGLTTIASLLDEEQYSFRGNQFYYNEDNPIRADNMGLVLDYSTRIDKINGNTRFLALGEKKKSLAQKYSYHTFRVPEVDYTFYMGVELEVGRKRNTPSDICLKVLSDLNKGWTLGQKYSFGILKRDGSLPIHGFEIVSAPATLEYHKTAWDVFFDNSAKYLRSYTLSQCGMHVHVSKQTFRDNGKGSEKNPAGHVGRFLNFYNRKDNRAFITLIAGRSANSYTSYHPKKVTDRLGQSITPTNVDRHQSINLKNEHTIEVRIFKGNVNKEGFMKNIEFVHASVEFTRQAGIGLGHDDLLYKAEKGKQGLEDCQGLSKGAFLKWVQQPAQISTYPTLTKWFKARGIINSTLVKLQDEVNPKDTRVNQPLYSNYLNDAA